MSSFAFGIKNRILSEKLKREAIGTEFVHIAGIRLSIDGENK